MRPRAWAFLALAFVLGAACVRLGIWQLSRLEERRQRNAQIEAGLALPALDLNAAAGGVVDPYRRAVARGTFDSGGQFLLSARSYHDQPGYHLVAPLHLADRSLTVIVDRGWIPYQQRDLLAQFQVDGLVEVQGVTKPSVPSPSFLAVSDSGTDRQPEERRTIAIPDLETDLGTPLLAVYLALEAPAGETEPAPIPQPEIDLSEGSHLGYAIQWFGFAAVAFGGGLYWIWLQYGQGENHENAKATKGT
jgi:surfeit locus 1 family protein